MSDKSRTNNINRQYNRAYDRSNLVRDKLTKIVATIGPASDSEEMVKKLILAGVNIFRFNFKHNTLEWHTERIQLVKSIAEELGVFVGTLIDLQGPEIRINMPCDELKVRSEELIVFGEKAFEKSFGKAQDKGFSISHPQIIPHLEEGQKIVADDGAFIFHLKKTNNKTYLHSDSNGILKNRKSINIPGADFPFPAMVDRDFEGLKLAQRNEIDFVALSFVRTAQDIEILRREMKKYHVHAKVIAKIETKKSLNHLESIINASDGVMVARGDMGVELPIEEVPYHQKILIKEAIRKGVPVITATQMLASMSENPYPTRAEVSDIANAVYDLTDSVMLSEETAVGKYPVETVDIMRKTVLFNESKNKVDSRLRFNFELTDDESLLCDTAYGLYIAYKNLDRKLSGFLIFTRTGRTVRLISRYRPLCPIFAFVHDEKIASSLTAHFGVAPFYHEVRQKKEIASKEIKLAIQKLKKMKLVQEGGTLIVLHTSTISLVTIE